MELENALNFIISSVQEECFSVEIKRLKNNLPLNKKSNILALNPFLKANLIRVGGRLKHSSYRFDKKNILYFYLNLTF